MKWFKVFLDVKFCKLNFDTLKLNNIKQNNNNNILHLNITLKIITGKSKYFVQSVQGILKIQFRQTHTQHLSQWIMLKKD